MTVLKVWKYIVSRRNTSRFALTSWVEKYPHGEVAKLLT